jgi:hypothetical protein
VTIRFERLSRVECLDCGTRAIVGYSWFKNGAWSGSYYDDGSRLFYIYVGLILFNWELRACVNFQNAPDPSRAEPRTGFFGTDESRKLLVKVRTSAE